MIQFLYRSSMLRPDVGSVLGAETCRQDVISSCYDVLLLSLITNIKRSYKVCFRRHRRNILCLIRVANCHLVENFFSSCKRLLSEGIHDLYTQQILLESVNQEYKIGGGGGKQHV